MWGAVKFAVVAAAVSLALPATASAPQLTDQRGDANGVNHQVYARGAADPSTPTEPASYAAGDVLSAEWAATSGGISVTLTLAAPPAEGVSYLVNIQAPGCGLFLRVEYDAAVAAPPTTNAYCNGTTPIAGVPAAQVSGARIVWTLPFAALTGIASSGDVLTRPWVETRLGVVHPAAAPPSPDGYARARVVVLDMAYGTGSFVVP
ncbi:MAG TPA: hypothetical protein VNQ77_14555 [Frankiaceae bacterium]|nr:hypothetical protein [Frankiaceae bacterium]